MTESTAATTNAMALGHTGTAIPLTETGQAKRTRRSCNSAINANTMTAIVVKGFMLLTSPAAKPLHLTSGISDASSYLTTARILFSSWM
jgi:hypothetical protein